MTNEIRHWINLVENAQLDEIATIPQLHIYLQEFVLYVMDDIEKIATQTFNFNIESAVEKSIITHIKGAFAWRELINSVVFAELPDLNAGWHAESKTIFVSQNILDEIIKETTDWYKFHKEETNIFIKVCKINIEKMLKNLFLSIIHEITHSIQSKSSNYRPNTNYSYAVKSDKRKKNKKGQNRSQKYLKFIHDYNNNEKFVAYFSSPQEIEAYAIQTAHEIINRFNYYNHSDLEKSINDINGLLKDLPEISKYDHNYSYNDNDVIPLSPKVLKRFHKKLYQALVGIRDEIVDELKSRKQRDN